MKKLLLLALPLTLLSCVKKDVKMVYYEVYFTDKTKDTLYLPEEYYIQDDNTLKCWVGNQWLEKVKDVKYLKEINNE